MKKNHRAIWVLFMALGMSVILVASVAPVALAREPLSQDPVASGGSRNLLSGKFADGLSLSEELATAMNAPPTSSSFTGNSNAGAVFSASSNFLPTEGGTFAVISTGNTSDIPGIPADFISTDFDPVNASEGDEARLTLNFTVQPWAHFLSFDFIFLSEEYPDFVGSAYNDYFYAELNETNIAFDTNGNIINVNNNFFDPTIIPANSFNGSTPLLRTTAAVEPNNTITLEFIVGDVGDGVYDTAVFLDNFQFLETGEPGTVSPAEVCQNMSDQIGEEFNLTIHVFNYDLDQSIVITNGVKTVGIRVDNQFTCDEVEDLLYSLDLTSFETLPEILVIDFSDSVNLKLWRSLGDFISGFDPDLYVQNLHFITGTGSFSRPDLNISCDDGEGNCYDERVIVGVALLTKMVQGYEGDPLGFDTIRISVEGESSTVVEYWTGEDIKLTVDFAGDLAQDLENVGAVDFVAGFGDALDWMTEASPEYHFIQCYIDPGGYEEKDELVVEYYLTEDDSGPSETVRFDQPSSRYMGAVLSGTGSSLGWGSGPEYNRTVCYTRPKENPANETELVIEYYLPDNDTPGLTLVIDPLTPRYAGAVTAGAGSVFGPGSSWKYELIVSYEANKSNKTSLYVDYYLNMSDYDNGSPALTLVIDPLTPRYTAALTAGTGSNGAFGSGPSYEKVLSYENVTGNKTTLILEYYLNESDPYPSLRLEFDQPSPPNTAAVTAGAGSTRGWGSPPHYDRMESYEQWNGEKYDLIVEYYLYENDTVPSLTLVIDPLELLEIAAMVAAAGSSETWIPVPPYHSIKCYKSGDCIIVELYKDGVKIAEQSFCDPAAPDLIERVIDFLTSFLFGVKAPALNLLGLLSLIGLLSITASRRLKGRSG